MLLKIKAIVIAFSMYFLFLNWVGAMELAEALRITKAWAEEVGGTVALNNMEVERNGAFTVEVKGAFIRYRPDSKTLLISGLVADGIGPFFTLVPSRWPRITRAAAREQSTLAEGQLELLNESLLRWKPQVVLLTKSFLDKKISDGRFFTEVRWLLEWSTYWRTRRYTEVIENKNENALIKEAMEINDWVAKNRPRPW